MQTSEARITARIRRTQDGETIHEYVVNGVGYGSLEAVEAVVGDVGR